MSTLCTFALDEVLDVLVEKIQGTENDDIAVLLLGYEDGDGGACRFYLQGGMAGMATCRIQSRQCFETRTLDWLGDFHWTWPSALKTTQIRSRRCINGRFSDKISSSVKPFINITTTIYHILSV